MRRTSSNICVLICAVAIGLNMWASCGRGTAAVSELPAPELDDRPAGSAPELPRVSVELPSGPTPSPTRVLSNGDDLQDALDDAKGGDVIALTPGATFKGPIKLRKRSENEWVTVRTNAADGVFPAAGTRVEPAHASMMPIIESASESAIKAEPGAHHYRFIGIEVRPRSGAFLYNLVELGAGENSVDELPHHIVFERCYVHGDRGIGGRRGIALNSRHTAVLDSHVADFKERGSDSQALAGWNGLGPFRIENNYLEAAGENVMFGGADPEVKNLVPADIEIRRNHFTKPLSWKIDHPSYAGTQWTIKNLFELKNARRVIVDGNVFENNWVEAQNGFAILFTPRNQDGSAPWSMVRDVTFTRNVVRHSGSAINIMGTDTIHPSQQTKRILIRGNLFEDIDGAKWGGSGRLFQILSGTADLVIEHNTALHTGEVITAEGLANVGFVYRNNLTPHNQYGVGGTDTTGSPSKTLSTYFPDAIFVKNILIAGPAGLYPKDNFFPLTTSDVGFADFAGGDYRLASTSRYKDAGTDGKDIGADIDATIAAREGRPPVPARRRAAAPGDQ